MPNCNACNKQCFKLKNFMDVCRVEGRTWYSSHRGRLWIAAAAKRPTPQEITQVEAMYRQVYKQGMILLFITKGFFVFFK